MRPINENEMVYGITYDQKKKEYTQLRIDKILNYTDDDHAYIRLTSGDSIYVGIEDIFFTKEDMLEALAKKGRLKCAKLS